MGGKTIRYFNDASAAGDVFYVAGVPYDSQGRLLVDQGLSTDSNGNTVLLGADGYLVQPCDPLMDIANAFKASIPAGKAAGTAPTRLIQPGTDWATGGSINAVARSVEASVWGRESNSLKVTPSANSNAYITYASAVSPKDWTGVTEFGFLIRSDQQLPANATISFSYGNDTTWANFKLCTLPLGSSGTRDGKQYIKFRVDQTTSLYGPFAGSPLGTGWSTGGTGATLNNNIQFIRLDFANLSGIPVWIEGIYSGGSTRPAVVLYLDNWWDQSPGAGYVKHTQYVKPILDRYGWKCGITVPLDAIGGANPTSLAGMRTMHDEGHDICLNDITDSGFITQGITDAVCAAQIAQTRQTLLRYGFSRGNTIWVLNQNESTSAQRALLSAAGVRLARAGVAERRFQHLEMGVENAMCVGSTGCDGVTSTNMKALFDRIVSYSAVAHLYWHKFNSGGTIDGARPGTSLTSWVEEFVDYMAYLRTLELAGSIDVLSPSQHTIRQKLIGNCYQAD